ncbi:unnamed protein product, partial [Adineta steineri]
MNNTDISTSYSWSNTVHECFIKQTQLYPQKLALELDEQSVTYSELLYFVYCLTNYLTDKIQPNEIICQCVERSFEIIIGMLAILSSGAVYCPLSPLDPSERLKTLIQDTSTKTLFIHKSFIIFNYIIKPISVTSDNIAFIIFTSGTKGIPKAIVISHSHLPLYLQSSAEVDAFRTTDRAIQLLSCTCDVHIHEIFGTLLVGGTVILLRSKQGNRNMDYLSQIIEIHQATYVCIVPTLQVLLFDIVEAQKAYSRLNTSFYMLCEPISCRFIARILPKLPIGCQYINFSGATESTVIQMFHVVTKDDGLSELDTVPSGQPMPYFRCHILDQFVQIIPIGYIGELFISGPIMNGYLDRPDLNNTALVQLPDEPDKSYRTGDLARLIPSTGKIQVLGRNDFQVKVNGQRVELEEIQAVIYQSNSSISNCAVVKVVERGRDHLIAYIQLNKTSTSIPFDEKLIHTNFQDHLPQYMTPSLFILVDQLPFNSNGKLDKAALPKPNLSSLLLPINNDEISNDQDNEISMTNEQQLVHDLWCDILQLDVDSKIPINRSFFSLG